MDSCFKIMNTKIITELQIGFIKYKLYTTYHTEDIDGYENDYLCRFFEVSDDCIIVAELNNEVIGYISIVANPEGEKYAYFDDFCVKKEYRDLGIGTALLQHSEDLTKIINISEIRLHIETTNNSALNLYKKNGYEILETEGSRFLMKKHFELFAD